MIKTKRMVYFCRICHRVGQRPLPCHPRGSAKYAVGIPGDERSRPLVDSHGHLLTRAPKWWIDACFSVRAEHRRV